MNTSSTLFHKTCLFLLLLATFSLPAQAQTEKKKAKYQTALGINAGYHIGTFRFPEGAIYAKAPFDRFQAPAFGGFARLYLTPRFHLQPEASFYQRTVNSPNEYTYLIELIGQTVRYRLLGSDQKIADGALLGYYHFKGSRILPYAGAGLFIGFNRTKSVAQEENAYGAGWKKSDIETTENETGVLLGGGVEIPFGQHFRILAEARYGIAGSTWKTYEYEIQKAVLISNVTIHKFTGQLGLAWKF